MPPDEQVEEQTPVQQTPPANQPSSTAFTQEDVNRLMNTHKKALKAELDEVKKQIAAKDQELAALRQRMEPQPLPDDLKGQLELLQKKHDRQMELLEKQLNEERKNREAEYQKRLDAERDRLLEAALAKAQCIDTEVGYRAFLPQCFYDADEQRWLFRLKSSNVVSIEAGIAEELPPYLKRPQAAGRGSGSYTSSATPKAEAKKQALVDAKAREAKAKAIAQSSNRESDRVAWREAFKEVQRLEKELQTPS